MWSLHMEVELRSGEPVAGTVRGDVVGVIVRREASRAARLSWPFADGALGDLAFDSVLARSEVVRSPSFESGIAEGAMVAELWLLSSFLVHFRIYQASFLCRSNQSGC